MSNHQLTQIVIDSWRGQHLSSIMLGFIGNLFKLHRFLEPFAKERNQVRKVLLDGYVVLIGLQEVIKKLLVLRLLFEDDAVGTEKRLEPEE